MKTKGMNYFGNRWPDRDLMAPLTFSLSSVFTFIRLWHSFSAYTRTLTSLGIALLFLFLSSSPVQMSLENEFLSAFASITLRLVIRAREIWEKIFSKMHILRTLALHFSRASHVVLSFCSFFVYCMYIHSSREREREAIDRTECFSFFHHIFLIPSYILLEACPLT